jgi:peptidyl-prolyl cis-trans isomerase SurA
MHKVIIIVLLIGALAVTVWGIELVDKVVAVVDNDPILASEVEAYAQFVTQQGGQKLSAEEETNLRVQILQELIDRRVLLAQAKKDTTINVEDREVDQELDNRLQGEINRLGSEQKLEDAYGRPLRQLKRDLRERIKEGMLIDRLKWQKQQQIHVTRNQVEAFWETYRDSLPEMEEAVKIRHILRELKPSSNAEELARQRAWRLYQEVKNGADFEQVAKDSSDDPGTASKGGDLGETTRGDLVPGYEEVAYQMQEGAISEPAKTEFGYHIIRLDWRRGEKIHSHHILVRIPTGKKDESEAIAFLDSLKTKVQAGESFADLAKKYSDDKDSAPAGGMLGWYEVSKLPSDFGKAVRGLKAGEMSAPFISEFGAHILQVVDYQEHRKMSLDKDWDRIEAMAKNQLRDKAFQEWVQQLRQQVYIDTSFVAETKP